MPRRLPSLNQLRAFEAAARHRSFKHGAAELCVTQAAVSHQIKALEEAMGVRLFIRQTRAVELTEAAERLLTVLSRGFDEIEAVTLELSGTAMAGELKISAAPFYGNRWLLPRLPGFHALYPGMTVTAALSFDVVDLRLEGLDAAVRYGTGDWPGLTSILIHEDRIGPVCAPQLVAGRNLPLAAEEIAALPLASTARWRQEWAGWFAAAGCDGEAAAVTEHDNRALAFDAALAGHAVCLADLRLTGSAEAAGNLVRINPLTIDLPQGIYVVYPETARPDPRVLAFADWLKGEALAVGTPA